MRWVEDMFNPQRKVVEPQVDSPLNKEVGDYIQLQKEAKEDYILRPQKGEVESMFLSTKEKVKSLAPKIRS
jgi:hypothetical protein